MTDLPANRFRARLKAGDHQLGIWSTIPEATAVEALAGAGFDWMVLDSEHTAVEPAAMLPLLQAVAAWPTAAVVRPAVNDVALIKRHLDMGAQTLLIPMVNSAAEAAAAVAAMRYAPEGLRGMAGTMRAARYGRVRDYAARAASELCLIVQVETQAAIAALDRIATTPGVDAVFFGPADLAASLGHPGQSRHPQVRDTILAAIARLKVLGVPSGILAAPDFARDCIAAGTSFTAVGVDMALLVAAADGLAAAMRGDG